MVLGHVLALRSSSSERCVFFWRIFRHRTTRCSLRLLLRDLILLVQLSSIRPIYQGKLL